MNELLEAALGYAAFGWRVLPVHGIDEFGRCTCGDVDCPKPGKHPAVSNWVERATTDPTPIRRAWEREPLLNIGIATGSRSGFIVLDVDVKYDGDKTLKDLIGQYGDFPDTVTAVTGSGGAHFLFQNIRDVGNRGGFAPGLDLRGEGGQIVVAPSRHVSGGVYRWLEGRGPGEVPLAEMPPWLRKLADAVPENTGKKKGAEPEYWRDLFAKGVDEGGRNQAVAQMSGYFIKRGLDPLLVLDIIRTWNKARVRPPLPDGEIETTVNSVAGKELARIARRRKRE